MFFMDIVLLLIRFNTKPMLKRALSAMQFNSETDDHAISDRKLIRLSIYTSGDTFRFIHFNMRFSSITEISIILWNNTDNYRF